MKTKEILNILLCGVIILAGLWALYKFAKWLLSFIAVSGFTLLTLTYMFAPVIIIVLLIVIIVKLTKR
ncbi:MAG: hypothetical protein IJL94_00130 [Erysipelotrichaceae bacterium]|nr:hypothetical protein [Erysipelotrichaceae bacterium]